MSNLFSTDSGVGKHFKHSGFSSTILDSYVTVYDNGIGLRDQNILGCGYAGEKYTQQSGFSDTITASITSFGGQPTSVGWDGSNVLGGLRLNDVIYKGTGFTTTISGSFNAPSTEPRQVSWGNGNLYSADYAQKLYLHNGFSATITASITAPASQTAAIWRASDDGNIMTNSESTDKIYKLDGFTTSILDSFTTPGDLSNGVAWLYTEDILASSRMLLGVGV